MRWGLGQLEGPDAEIQPVKLTTAPYGRGSVTDLAHEPTEPRP